jgi:hypothetical protein
MLGERLRDRLVPAPPRHVRARCRQAWPGYPVQVLLGEQSGVEPVQALVLLGVHWTHVLVVPSQAGVGDAHSASLAQGSHLPVFGPL